MNLTADNTATAVVANQQFTGSDVYQLDFTFANIKLEVPANQGMSNNTKPPSRNLVTGIKCPSLLFSKARAFLLMVFEGRCAIMVKREVCANIPSSVEPFQTVAIFSDL